VKILLLEDDDLLAETLQKALISQHHLVEMATDGQAGWDLAEAFEYDLILLDLMLPKLDGISFCRKLRKTGDRTPILLLTAQDTSNHKVAALDAGADDYVVKPFDMQELLARIRALLRRVSSTTTPLIECGDLRLDPSNCEVTYDGQLLRLTSKEYGLIELFLRNTHRIFSQSALLDHLWLFEELPSENTVRAHIKSLRQKLKKAGAPADLIETVYGLGYRLKPRESGVVGTKHLSEKPGHNSTDSGTKIDTQKPTSASSSGGTPKGQTLTGSPLIAQTTDAAFPTPHSATTAGSTQQDISELTSGVWERFKGKYSDRITVLEKAVTACLEDSLTEELRQQAMGEAHTLVGSLGSFGFDEASRLSREIEQMFQSQGKLSQQKKESLSGLVVALRQALEQPPATLDLVESQPVASLNQPTPVKQQCQLLIVDDDEALALALTVEATARGMQAQVATNLSKARAALAYSRPDVVLLDLCFPDSAENGLGLLAELATYQPPVPVVVFTAQQNFADRVKVARLGGRGFLQKPVSPAQVMEAIAQVLQQSSPSEAKLLIVDDDPHLLDFLRTLLEPWGFKLTLLNNPQQFWETLEQTVPDLVILDVEMPELSGIDLCQVVRNDPRWSELPVLFLSAHTDAKTVHQVFTVGADDYVNKPIVGPELVARVLNRLERAQILRNWRTLMG
jgi:DNA-binding response OmpR family regulator